jgi:hypothetical protein
MRSGILAMSSCLDGTQFQHLTSQNNIYSLQRSLKGHQGAVLCLRVTDDGKVASGGESLYYQYGAAKWIIGTDGVRVWELPTMTLLESPTGEGQRGAATSLVWIRREDEPEDGLVYGTQNGFLVCWKQTKSSVGRHDMRWLLSF